MQEVAVFNATSGLVNFVGAVVHEDWGNNRPVQANQSGCKMLLS